MQKLNKPIEILLPLRGKPTKSNYCMEHSPAEKWNKIVEKCAESQDSHFMSCCVDNFGTFAVQKFVRGYGILEPYSPLFYCLVTDIVILVLLYVGKVLDTKKIWVVGALSGAENDVSGIDKTVKVEESSNVS